VNLVEVFAVSAVAIVSFLVIRAVVVRYVGRGPADWARRRAAREDRKRRH
jgi:hypothetical protein